MSRRTGLAVRRSDVFRAAFQQCDAKRVHSLDAVDQHSGTYRLPDQPNAAHVRLEHPKPRVTLERAVSLRPRSRVRERATRRRGRSWQDRAQHLAPLLGASSGDIRPRSHAGLSPARPRRCALPGLRAGLGHARRDVRITGRVHEAPRRLER